MRVDDTAPRPGSSTPSFPVAGAIWWAWGIRPLLSGHCWACLLRTQCGRPWDRRTASQRCLRRADPGKATEHGAVADRQAAGIAEGADTRGGAARRVQAGDRVADQVEHRAIDGG